MSKARVALLKIYKELSRCPTRNLHWSIVCLLIEFEDQRAVGFQEKD